MIATRRDYVNPVRENFTYPRRCGFYMKDVLNALRRRKVASSLGKNVFTLLVIIASQENDNFYSKPVSFTNKALMSETGIGNERTLISARDKAISTGWLRYVPGARNHPGLYYVQIPSEQISLPGLDPQDSELTGKTASQSPQEQTGTFASQSTNRLAEVPDQSADSLAEVPDSLNKKNKDKKTRRSGGMKKKVFQSLECVVIPPVLDVPEFRAAWAEWREHRREVSPRKPLTTRAMKMQLDKLASFGLARALASIKESISNGWLGLFEPRGATRRSEPECGLPRARPLSKFEMAHMIYDPYKGAERNPDGSLVLTKLCRDLACGHCKPRRAS